MGALSFPKFRAFTGWQHFHGFMKCVVADGRSEGDVVMRAKSFLPLVLAFLLGALGGALFAPQINVGEPAKKVQAKSGVG